MADATPICFFVELLEGSRQPMTGRLATHHSNTTVKIYRVGQKSGPQIHDHNSVKSEPIKKNSLENALVNF